MVLYSVHEVALRAVEDDDGEEEGDQHEDGAIEQAAPTEGAAAHATVFKGLENRGEGVEFEDGAYLAAGGAHRVDDRGGIHEQLDTETDELSQITVFGSESRYDEAPGEGMEGGKEHEEGEKHDIAVDFHWGTVDRKIDVDGNEEEQLDAELHEVGGDRTQGHNQTGKIDLAEDTCISGEYIGARVEAVAKVSPKQDAGHIEEGLGHAVGGYTCQIAKHKHKHDGGKKWLDDKP